MTIAAALDQGLFAPPENRGLSCWADLACYYPAPRERLAAYLAQVAAEVLAEVKPANLVRLVDRDCAHCRNIESLWHRLGGEILADSPLEVLELPDDKPGVLLLVYRPEVMSRHLEAPRTRSFLKRLHFPVDEGWRQTLSHLVRCFQGEGFPHEIGVFLGYPLKDVAGFLGWGKLRQSASGPWKIYGNPVPSLKLVKVHKFCKQWLLNRLRDQVAPETLLKGFAV